MKKVTQVMLPRLDRQRESGQNNVQTPMRIKPITNPAPNQVIGFSKKMIEDKIGHKITSFCYPYAFPEHNKNLKQFLNDTLHYMGYQNCLTTNIGRLINEDEYFIKRIPVNSRDDTTFLNAKVNGGYDWIYLIQKIAKSVKNNSQIK